MRLPEKGGKRNAMPCHHNLEGYLTAHLAGAGLGTPVLRQDARGRRGCAETGHRDDRTAARSGMHLVVEFCPLQLTCASLADLT
jgi:hypothetical protein